MNLGPRIVPELRGYRKSGHWNELFRLTSQSTENQVQKKQYETCDGNSPTCPLGLKILATAKPSEKPVVHNRKKSTCAYCPNPEGDVPGHDEERDYKPNAHPHVHGCVFFSRFSFPLTSLLGALHLRADDAPLGISELTTFTCIG